jgi:hypothetical protein
VAKKKPSYGPRAKGLIILCESDGGVAHVVLVPLAVTDWICSDPKNKDHWREKIPGTDEYAEVTIGTYENDRALHVVSTEREGFAEHFNSAREALTYVRDKDVDLLDVYSGLVY